MVYLYSNTHVETEKKKKKYIVFILICYTFTTKLLETIFFVIRPLPFFISIYLNNVKIKSVPKDKLSYLFNNLF